MKVEIKLKTEFEIYLDDLKEFRCVITANKKRGTLYDYLYFSFENMIDESRWLVVYSTQSRFYFWEYENEKTLKKKVDKVFKKAAPSLDKLGLNKELVKFPWIKFP